MDHPFAEPSDTRQAILGAAFRALCEHGYANVTIKRIGDEFDKSPSLVYHHYDGKDELLIDLLEFLLAEFEASIAGERRSEAGEAGSAVDPSDAFNRSAREQLDAYLTATTDPSALDDEYAPGARFFTVMTELRSQAANNEAYRDHFDRSDRVFSEYLEGIVREAAAEVAAEDAADGSTGPDPEAETVDPAEVAATLQTFATGSTFRLTTTAEAEWVDGARAGIDRYLESVLPLVDPDAGLENET
ncbi:TetR/AcrR family transcriptional regulator [Halorubrum ejinorense]|uniref:TetR/AcrR family transcriptional regulator n=1 Tax=Halorubrum ejinorense TaxID=425309 RepID=A0AAV3SWC7_9EURY